jgi:Peptidase_C39 like family
MKTLSTKNLLAKIPFNKNLFNMDMVTRSLTTITKTPTRKVALAAAGLAVTGGAIAGPVLAAGPDAHAASAAARPAVASTSTGGGQAAASPAAQKAAQVASQPRDKEVNVDYQAQTTFYYCAPAATQIAASAQGHTLSQDDLAGKLGTTVNGTNSADDTTRVLNNIVGSDVYHTTAVPGKPSQAQVDQVQADVMRSLNDGRAVVANIAGATTDVTAAKHDFPGGHYLTVVGYHDNGGTVRISDPADVNGASDYWISTSNLANWMATHGYSH